MIEETKIVVLKLTPSEYDDRAKVLAEYIFQQIDNGWTSTRRRHLRYSFDANYNAYYVRLTFEKNHDYLRDPISRRQNKNLRK